MLDRAAAKIRAALGKATGAAATAGQGPEAVALDVGGPVRDQVFSPLERASREHRAVELDYASVSGQRRRPITVEPYGILNHTGGWYVVGKSLTHAADRAFAFKLERIRSVKVLDQHFDPPADFDLRDYRGERMFIAGLAPVEVKLRLRGSAARRLGPDFKRAKQERDGSIVVRHRDCVNGWLAAWVLRQGPEVEVLSPPGLAARVGELARRVLGAHAVGETVAEGVVAGRGL